MVDIYQPLTKMVTLGLKWQLHDKTHWRDFEEVDHVGFWDVKWDNDGRCTMWVLRSLFLSPESPIPMKIAAQKTSPT
jgi:hypothetical protein